MPRPTVLVVDREDSRRKELVRGLTSYGYEVVAASGADEGRRFAEGLRPGLIVVEGVLVDAADPFGLRAARPSAEAGVPTAVLFAAEDADELPEGVLAVKDSNLSAATLLLKVRTALVGRDLGLAVDAGLDSLIGELQRWPLFELLPSLQRAVVTGRVELAEGQLFLEDGEVIAARLAGHSGVKAFARLARTADGTFRVVLGPPAVEREIFKDLLTMMAIAIEDQHLYEETRARLPNLSSRLQLVLGPTFFATQFSPSQQRVIEAAQESRTPWHLLDKVEAPDGEVLHDLAQLRRLAVVRLDDPEVEVRIVTDSAADLSGDLAKRLRIRELPLSLIIGRELYRDRVDLAPLQLYRVLASKTAHRHPPRIEPVGREEIAATYRTLVGRSDIVSLHVSGRMSETVTNARATVEKGEDEFRRARGNGAPTIAVVDSMQTSVGLGLLAVAAARMAIRHLHADEIGTRVEAMRSRLHVLLVADGMESLARDGRVGKVRARLAALLGIKPILSVVEGRLVIVDQVRTGKTAHPRVIELLRQRVAPGVPAMVGIAHALAPVWAVRLRNLIQDAFPVSEVIESEIGVSVGTVLGAGAVAVALLQPNAEEEPLVAPVTDSW
jgi:DegV family protein with EDD domain